jgi:hypothetical protein
MLMSLAHENIHLSVVCLSNRFDATAMLRLERDIERDSVESLQYAVRIDKGLQMSW